MPLQQGRIAPDRAFARTGGVEQDAVELTAGGRPVARIALGRGHIDDAEPVQIALERLDPAIGDVVGDDRAPVVEREGDLGGLAAGRGAHVEHALTGLEVHEGDRQ